MKYLRKRPFGISFVLIFEIRHFESWKKAKNLEFGTTHKYFSRLSDFLGEGAWVVPQKKTWRDRDVTFWKDISQN